MLGPAGFGDFFLVYSIILVGMTFVEFGLGSRALRVAADPEPGVIVTTVIVSRIFTSTLVSVGVVIFATMSGILNPLLAVLLAVYATGDLFANLVQSFLIGFFREKSGAALLLARRVLVVAALIPGLFVSSPDPWIYGALALGGLFGYVSGVASLRRHFGRFSNPFSFVSRNRRYWASSVATNIQQADVIFIGALGSATLAGLYAAANRLASPLNLLTSSVLQSTVPHISAKKTTQEKFASFGRVRRVMFGFALLLAVLSVAAPLAVLILFGDEYRDAWPIAVSVTLVAALNAIIQTFLAWYYSVGIPRAVPWVLTAWSLLMLIGVAIGAALNVLLLVGVGQVAAALLAVIGIMVIFKRRPVPIEEV